MVELLVSFKGSEFKIYYFEKEIALKVNFGI